MPGFLLLLRHDGNLLALGHSGEPVDEEGAEDIEDDIHPEKTATMSVT